MSNKESSQEFILDFIKEYKKHPSLWQQKHPNYKKHNIKAVAYEALRQFCHKSSVPWTLKTVKAKINNLKTAFRRELRKCQASLCSETSADRVYKSNLFYFDALLFTSDENPRTSKSSKSGFSDNEEKDSDNEYVDDVQEENKSEQNVSLVSNDVKIDEITMEVTDIPPSPELLVTPKKRIKYDKNTTEGNMANIIPIGCSTLNEKSDEFDAIGINVAAKLRSLDPNQRIVAEKLISDVLFFAQIKKLTQQCRFTPTPLKSYPGGPGASAPPAT